MVPTISEQLAIVESIRSATSPVDDARGSAEREIALMHEYRTRLVADVVTGQLDVREAAARLPAEAPEPDTTAEPIDDLDADAVEDEPSEDAA